LALKAKDLPLLHLQSNVDRSGDIHEISI
jgi:hypothetical protein